MSAETTGVRGFDYWRLRFRDWRYTRPFWAGLFTALGGGVIIYFPYAHLTFGHLTLTMGTPSGAGSLIIGVLLITLGLTMWYQHVARVFAGVAAILLALVSIPVSNIGGFVVGFLLSMVGGCLALAWAPGTPADEEALDKGALDKGALGGEHFGTEPAQEEPQHDSTDGHVDANGGRNSAG